MIVRLMRFITLIRLYCVKLCLSVLGVTLNLVHIGWAHEKPGIPGTVLAGRDVEVGAEIASGLASPDLSLTPWPAAALVADESAGSYLIRKSVLAFYAAAEARLDAILPAWLNSNVIGRKYGIA